MAFPTDAEMKRYDEMRAQIRTDRAAGKDVTAQLDDLHKFMLEAGIGSEAPPTDFPELDESGKP